MQTPGVYLPSRNLIIIDGTRCENIQKKSLFHELAHARFHSKKRRQYQSCNANRMDMEVEANHCMIRKLIKHFIRKKKTNFNDVDWSEFSNKFNLDRSLVVKIAKTHKFKFIK